MLHVDTETDDDAWREILQDPEKTFKLKIKHQAEEQRTQSSTKTVKYDLARLREIADSTEILFDGMDLGSQLIQGYKDSAIYKGKRVSEIVEEIASRVGLQTDVKATSDTFTLWQCNYPDAFFLRYVLLPRAYNENRSDYLFYIKNGTTLVFGPPNLTAVKVNFALPPRGGDQEGIINVEEHEFDLRDTLLAPMRSLSTVVRGYDPIRKRYIEVTADDSTVGPPTLARTGVVPPVLPSRAVMINGPYPIKYDERGVQKTAEAIWSFGHRLRYECRIAVRGLLLLNPGDVFRIDSRHWMGGKWLCSGIRQWLSPKEKDLWTSVYGIRREHN
jgi:hypothetical protein